MGKEGIQDYSYHFSRTFRRCNTHAGSKDEKSDYVPNLEGGEVGQLLTTVTTGIKAAFFFKLTAVFRVGSAHRCLYYQIN